MARNNSYDDLVKIKTVKQKKQEQQEEIINADILSIERAIDNGCEDDMREVHMIIEGKYGSCIPNLGKSMYGYLEKYGFNYEMIGVESLHHNLKLMKAKLEGYLYGFPIKAITLTPQNNISVNVPITNSVNLSITFEQAKQKIEDMPGLSDCDTDEMKDKIDELKSISQEDISRKKKWEKVKPILAFALDKGVDVAITVMSLILQMKLGV